MKTSTLIDETFEEVCYMLVVEPASHENLVTFRHVYPICIFLSSFWFNVIQKYLTSVSHLTPRYIT